MSPRPVSGNRPLQRPNLLERFRSVTAIQPRSFRPRMFCGSSALDQVSSGELLCWEPALSLCPAKELQLFLLQLYSFPGWVAQHHVEPAGIKYFGKLQGPVEEAKLAG